MYTCASCTLRSCQKGGGDLPRNCPMRDPEFFDRLLERYWSEENHDFFVTSAAIESAGYCRWPRLKEIVEFSRSMHYQKLGLAFCAALKKEAAVVERVLRNNGFQVVSVICKTGGLDKSRAGVPEECKLQPGQFEAMCNPIAQAELLNSQDTQFNICLGLCVGHDSLFYQYSKALVTTLTGCWPTTQWAPSTTQTPISRICSRADPWGGTIW